MTVNEYMGLRKVSPLQSLGKCIVVRCARQRSGRALCSTHEMRYRALSSTLGDAAPPQEVWAKLTTPILSRGDFSLAALPEPLRSELAYAIQAEDAAGYLLDPNLIRQGVGDFWAAGESFLEEGFLGRAITYVNRGPFTRRAVVALRRLRHEFEQTDPFDADIWDSYLVGFETTSRLRGRTTAGSADKFLGRRVKLDFTPIRQAWLRDVAKQWAKDLHPSTDDVTTTIASFALMSEVLSNRPGGDDPSTAGTRDIRRFIHLLNTKKRENGRFYSPNWRSQKLRYLRQALHYVRGLGTLDHVPLGFTLTLDDRVSRTKEEVAVADPDQSPSRAIPYRVVDAALAAVANLEHPGNVLGSDLTADEHTELLRTVLRVLIDTGRRPGEICRLRVGCVRKSVEQIDPTTVNYELVYNNTKAGRPGRTIPIGLETAQVIEKWEERRLAISISALHDGWLFPPSTAGRADAGPHFSVSNLAGAVDRLIATIPRLESDVPDRDSGGYIQFTGPIEAYSFRHAYAQRHADAGTAPDTLKELMDHKSIETTMGYYTVGNKRKREAIEKIAPMALNYKGERAPIESPSAYELASVAVPFGSCTDPANVKAGGHACRIRFKCAGCHLYRPDPSYLPPLEEHLKQLRLTLSMVSMAGTAAPWVLDSMREEIESYDVIVRRLKEEIEALPLDEQAAIDESGAALRRSRAQRPLLPLSVKGRD